MIKNISIVYPYNEILPRNKAHDVYIFNNCLSLANACCNVALLCGKGRHSKEALYSHYRSKPCSQLSIQQLPIVRKNNLLNISWNLPFFFQCQHYFKKKRPNFVLLSVLKQAQYHLKRKIAGIKYVYEVHQLAWYPNLSLEQYIAKVKAERALLEKVDLITVTTSALKEILLDPPYSLSVPIAVVPLAVNVDPLPLPNFNDTERLQLFYVGQLYRKQGISFLLEALQSLENVQLTIIGGSKEEVIELQEQINSMNLTKCVILKGFHPPSALPQLLHSADAFIAPFEASERMPYVAHTKLLEYAQWGRPIIAPDLPCVQEEFPNQKGLLLFETNNVASLRQSIQQMQQTKLRQQLQKEIQQLSNYFSWPTRTDAYAKHLSKIQNIPYRDI